MNPEVADDIHADIRAAMVVPEGEEVVETPIEEPQAETIEEKAARERDEKGRFRAKAEEVKEEVKEPLKQDLEVKPDPVKSEAPTSWTGAVKEKWSTLPPEVQAEISKRENDIHQMFTRHDGELRLGRELKEVISPYMPIIQSEGGTPAKAVNDLLNTAYQLRTAPAPQKAALVQHIITQYGVDMSLLTQEQGDPTIAALNNEIAQLKQRLEPGNLEKHLQSFSENANITAEVRAFASDPANVHYEAVKPIMAALLGGGTAGNLKEAYNMACMAKPEIRSIIDAEKKKADEEKRKSEIEAKKRAAVSISGSPSNSTAKPSNNSIEDDLRDAFRAQSGLI